jgi:hypothetical protein
MDRLLSFPMVDAPAQRLSHQLLALDRGHDRVRVLKSWVLQQQKVPVMLSACFSLKINASTNLFDLRTKSEPLATILVYIINRRTLFSA